MSLVRKLFIDGDWNIAIRKRSHSDELFDYSSNFISIPHNKKYWFADPLVFNYKGTSYLFCEAFDRKAYCGVLGYFLVNEDGTVGEFKELIRENYHLSFPGVFVKDEKIYMLPESGENESLSLYVAEEFPDKWKKVCSFTADCYADPVVFTYKGKHMLFIYADKAPFFAKIYEIDFENQKLDLINSIDYENNIGRPAGYFFEKNGELYRPTQNSKEMYGKSLLINKITSLAPKFTEENVFAFSNENIVVDGKKGIDRIHTYSVDDNFECIDYCNFHFDLFKRFKIMKRARKVKNRKKQNREMKQ